MNVKTGSSKWIKTQELCPNFAWQKRQGAFPYAKSQVNNPACYIQHKEIHHRMESFFKEYRKFLTVFEIGSEEKYIFKEPAQLLARCVAVGAVVF